MGYKRRTKLEELMDTRTIMRGAAPHAAAYLRDIVKRKVKRPSQPRIDCAKFIIDHEIGKPPQRHEIAGVGGTPLTLVELVLAAQAAGILPPAAPQLPGENGGDGGADEVIEGSARVLEETENSGKEGKTFNP
jgi:hypothetical protein